MIDILQRNYVDVVESEYDTIIMVQLCFGEDIGPVDIDVVPVGFDDGVQIETVVLVDNVGMMVVDCYPVQLDVYLYKVVLPPQPNYLFIKRVPYLVI